MPNTWQIDCHFVRFDAARCAFHELPIFIGNSLFQSDWVGRDSNPEPTPLQGGVPIIYEGKVIGAIGVSGNTPQGNEDIAKVGAASAAAAIAN